MDAYPNAALVAVYNDQVGKCYSGQSWQNLLLIIEELFLRRGIDYTSLSDANGLTFKHAALLVGNKMHLLSEVPEGPVEMIVKLFLKENKSTRFEEVKLSSRDNRKIYYKIGVRNHILDSDKLIRWFTDFVAKGGKSFF